MNEVFTSYLNTIESEIKRALPAESNAAWVADVFGSEPQDLLPEHIAPLLQPTRALVNLGGKRWRPLLLVLTAEACLADRPQLSDAERKQLLADAFHLAPLVEFVHTASLIHDDIEDNSDTRRGKPAAYITYGTDTAINAASWLYFQAPVCIDTLSLPAEQKARLYALYAMELRRLHLGQAMDIAWHRTPAFLPTEGQYLTMVMHKTGTLASLAAKTGMLAAGAGEAQAADAGRLPDNRRCNQPDGRQPRQKAGRRHRGRQKIAARAAVRAAIRHGFQRTGPADGLFCPGTAGRHQQPRR